MALGHIYKRGNIWWIQYYRHGRRFQESSKSPRKADAKALLEQRVRRPLSAEAARMRLADLKELVRDDYAANGRKSWTSVERRWKSVAAYFGEHAKVADITALELARYRKARLEAGAKPATIQQELAYLRRGFRLAARMDLVAAVPVFPTFGVIRNARPEFVEDWEWALMRPDLPGYWQDLGDVAMWMGWRPRAELITLTWDRVDLVRGEARLERYTTKNDDARFWPIGEVPEVLAAFQRRRAATDDVEAISGELCPWVFHRNGTPLFHRRGNGESSVPHDGPFYGPWKAACRKHGVLGADGKPKHPHDFRRSGIRNLDQAGVSRDTARQMVGHRTDDMYSRYNIQTPESVRRAVRQLREARAGVQE